MRHVLTLTLVLLAVGCGTEADQPETGPQSGGGKTSDVLAPGGGLTITEALASASDDVLAVRGFLIARDEEPPRLCEGLRESYPPQCMDPSLVLRGIDLDVIRGVVTANGVSFTNDEITLFGTVHGTVLAVNMRTI